MKIYSLVFTLCFLINIGLAQDAHFSQPMMSPLQLNPAMTGHMQNGIARISSQVRGQWWTVASQDLYQNMTLGFDRRFCGRQNHFAFGVQLSSNELLGNPLSSTLGHLSGAYHFNLGGTRLALGGQAGWLQYRLRENRLNFEDQFDANTSTIANRPSAENFPTNALNVFDGSVGLLFYSTASDNNNFVLGMAIHHFNQPEIRFLEEAVASGESLRMKWTVHGTGKFMMVQDFFFSPSFVVQLQGKQWYGLFGAMPSLNFFVGNSNKNKVQSVGLGAFLRATTHQWRASALDAIIVQSFYDFGSVRLNVAFDFNISNLSVASQMAGAVEIGAIYQFGEENNCVYCPNF